MTIPEDPVPNVRPSEKRLSVEENRAIVTPYAFGVADELLGKKLATPFQRALAQVVDIVVIALLSYTNGVLLGFLIALTFFRAGQQMAKSGQQTITRRLLRILGAGLLFWVTVSLVQLYNSSQDAASGSGISDQQAGAVLNMVEKIALKACDTDTDCKLNIVREFAAALADTEIKRQAALVSQHALLADTGLTPEELSSLERAFLAEFDRQRDENELAAKQPLLTSDTSSAVELNLPSKQDAEKLQRVAGNLATLGEEPAKPSAETYSIIEWVKGILGDLGLGFGWAALYFSVFTAWWQGRTPGKRLLSIKVLKLDGSSLTLWESFGRYGGYGAGLATGLLGFLQIYWDMNRQAIQDKISETLVIQDD